MKKILLLLILLISSVYSKDDTKLLNKVIDLTYNLKLDDAEKILLEWEPENRLEQAEKYYNLTRIEFLKYLGTSDSATFAKFESYSDSALIFAAGARREEHSAFLAWYLEGTVYTMRAFTQSRLNNTIKAFLSSSDAVSAFEESLELNPEFYDNYQGLGLFNYALSYVPGIYNIALSLTGLSSDKRKGLDYLRLSWEKGSYDRPDAGFNLAKIYMDYVAEYDSSEVIYKELLRKFPGNVLYSYQYAILKFRTGKHNEALGLLDDVIKVDHPYFKQTTAYAYFLKGDIFLNTGKYARGLENYEIFLNKTLNIDYLGIANYRAAVCARLTDETEKMTKHLMLSGNGNPELAEDKFAAEKGNYLLKNGFSETEVKLHKIETELYLGEYKSAYQKIHNLVLAEDYDKSQEALVFYYVSKAAFELRDYGMAEKYALKAIDADKELDMWVETGSWLILAEIYIYAGRSEKAEDFLENAEDENSYQKSEIFEAQINSLKRTLGIL